jgi:hypothetical protein
MTPGKASAAAALFAIGLTSVFYIDLCDLIFRCGCDHLWAGADARCNIHNADGRHCPFCSFGWAGYGITYGGIVAPQALLAFRPKRWTLWRRLAAAVLAFPLIGGLQALVLGWATGYWN